jgi:DICT domain-containing protein
VDVPIRHALANEWNVIVVGPSYTGALVAQDLGDVGDTRHRRYEHIVTHDRDLVVEAARSLLRWIDRRQGE